VVEETGVFFLRDKDFLAPCLSICESDFDVGRIISHYNVVAAYFLDPIQVQRHHSTSLALD
jgi:hypothetical protein